MNQYLIYLRKSRADRDTEARSGGDTLARHRATLLELSERLKLKIVKIFEEIVSGDSISARPEMQKLLRAVESGRYAGVLVMEVERLARGNTRDQGIVAETFQYSGTKIITPGKIFDPSDEADQEYFEFGLFMSRREYKTINRRLQRGRNASLREGKYIAAAAPYGYSRVKLSGQKGYTLVIDQEKAPVVHRIYNLYVHGVRQKDGSIRQCGFTAIARILNTEGLPSPAGGNWQPCTIKDMLINPTYAGMLRWSYRPTVQRMENGQRVSVRPVNHEIEYLPGLHSPIIDRKTWDCAQAILAGRTHASLRESRKLLNPLAGIIYCSQCGTRMERRKYRHGRAMLLCPNQNCRCVSAPLEDVEQGVLDALSTWLNYYQLDQPAKSDQAESNEAVRSLEDSISRLNTTLSTLHFQQGQLCDLLEQGIYSAEIFSIRNRILTEKITQAKAALETAKEQLEAELKAQLQPSSCFWEAGHPLDPYPFMEISDKNELLKILLHRVEYFKTNGGRWVSGDLHLSIFPAIRVLQSG